MSNEVKGIDLYIKNRSYIINIKKFDLNNFKTDEKMDHSRNYAEIVTFHYISTPGN